ncbi:MAG: 16S rRNA (cytidine(1402)-2'-O)-methyltransferase [Bacteroidota bacterium]|nr:16S rRNA (cytidine(1402)-2'-O)-methyltransferase [Bacteroidota bacterium]
MSKLYIIPTPIGNLEDITLRAIRILKEVDCIIAEDTRTTGNLMKHLGISKKMFAHHIHNEHKTVELITSRIISGENIGLVTDAGTPGISDPGFLLVRHCIEQGIEVECLPGPTALIPALINSGLPADRFIFEGFLPQKKGRHTRIQELAEEKRTIIIYESPHRLVKTLEQLIQFFGKERRVSVSRELTKIYEETQRGTLTEIFDFFKDKNIKGEIVIVIEGKEKNKDKKNSDEESNINSWSTT